MRGAHAVGAYLSTTLPVEPNPRGLKLKVNRAADADSPLRALTRRSEKRRGAQQPRCHEARCNGAKHLIDDGICGGATMRFSSFFPKRSAKRSFCPPIWMNAHATWWWSKKTHRGNTMYGMLLESVQHFVQVNVIGVKEEWWWFVRVSATEFCFCCSLFVSKVNLIWSVIRYCFVGFRFSRIYWVQRIMIRWWKGE